MQFSNSYILCDEKTPEPLDQARAHACQCMCEYYCNDPVINSYPLCR